MQSQQKAGSLDRNTLHDRKKMSVEPPANTQYDQHPSRVEQWSSLPLFFSLAFGWSWILWLGSAALPKGSTGPGLLRILATFGPSLAALMAVGLSSGKAGMAHWIASRLTPPVPLRWYCVSFLSPLALMYLALTIHAAPFDILGSSQFRNWWVLPLNFLLIFLLGGPLGEEPGWRGFALPALQNRMSPSRASAILGAIWAFWHLPLFLIDGTVQSQIPFWLFLANAIPLSLIIGWIFNRTGGSLIPVLVLHTAVNGWTLVVPIVPNENGYMPFAIVTAMMWPMALLCHVAGYTARKPGAQ
jgi:hypothetical protein